MPKIPSYRIGDVAEAIGPECERTIVGIRPGEKIHEEMITASDSFNTIDMGDYYAILPVGGDLHGRGLLRAPAVHAGRAGLRLQQRQQPEFLSVEELRALIRDHVRHGRSAERADGHDSLRSPGHHRGRHRRGGARCCAPIS